MSTNNNKGETMTETKSIPAQIAEIVNFSQPIQARSRESRMVTKWTKAHQRASVNKAAKRLITMWESEKKYIRPKNLHALHVAVDGLNIITQGSKAAKAVVKWNKANLKANLKAKLEATAEATAEATRCHHSGVCPLYKAKSPYGFMCVLKCAGHIEVNGSASDCEQSLTCSAYKKGSAITKL